MVLDNILGNPLVKRLKNESSSKNQTRVARLLPAVVLLFISIILLGTGCNQAPCDGEHKQLTVERDFAHFSLEYPCNWRSTRVETHQERDRINLSMSIMGPTIQIEDSRVPSATWNLAVFWPSEEIPNAAAAQENGLAVWGSFQSFELIRRSRVEIAGIAAEQVIFYDIIPADGVRITEPIPNKVWILHFDYGGLIWSIHSSSVLAVSDENEAHLDRILETFQILD